MELSLCIFTNKHTMTNVLANCFCIFGIELEIGKIRFKKFIWLKKQGVI